MDDQKPGLSTKAQVINSGIQGHGWFAKEDIQRGEIVFRPYPDGNKFDFHISTVLSWPQERRRKFFKISYQVDDEIYNGYHSDMDLPEEQKLEWCLNHSCDPNVWYLTKDLVEARRDIKKGEELCYDYANIILEHLIPL